MAKLVKALVVTAIALLLWWHPDRCDLGFHDYEDLGPGLGRKCKRKGCGVMPDIQWDGM